MTCAPSTHNENKPKRKIGRPRTVSPEPAECIELGEEMVEWVILNKPTHLTEWFSIEKMIPWKMWDAMCQIPEFLPYYEIALSLVAKSARDGTLNTTIAQRFLSLYHRDMKRMENDDVKFKAQANAQEIVSTSMTLADIKERLQAGLLSQKD